jgi:Zn-dependent protease
LKGASFLTENKPENSPKKPRGKLLSWLLGFGAIFLSFGSKLKSLLPLLKLGKFGGTLISLAVSVWAYALLYPFELALGLVVLMFIHEMGHIWAAKRKGLPVTAPAFIPFLGALIMLKRQPQDALTEAYIAYGGPLIGTIGALLCYGLGVWTGYDVFYAIAMIGFFLNLFNLIPIHPMDGGRIVVAITRWVWVAGLVLGLVLVIYLKSFLLLFIYLLFVFDLWAGFRKRRKGVKPTKMKDVIQVPAEMFIQNGVWIPGEEHRRLLHFRQYCDLTTRESVVEVEYPGVGTIKQLEGFEGQIEKVELVKTQMSPLHPGIVFLHIEIQFFIAKEDVIEKEKRYYKVPLKKRLQYTFAYLGLIALLIYMMVLTYPYVEQIQRATS